MHCNSIDLFFGCSSIPRRPELCGPLTIIWVWLWRFLFPSPFLFLFLFVLAGIKAKGEDICQDVGNALLRTQPGRHARQRIQRPSDTSMTSLSWRWVRQHNETVKRWASEAWEFQCTRFCYDFNSERLARGTLFVYVASGILSMPF